MAVIDSLEVIIQSKAETVNKSLDDLVRRLGLVAEGISAIGQNKGLEDFSKKAADVTKGFANIQNAAKGISAGMEPQMRKVAKSFEQITEQYKNLGKGFTFKGSADEIQKQIDKYTNSLETAKLKKEELETAGKTEGKAYEAAVAKTIEYANVIEGLRQQLADVQAAQLQFNFNIGGIEDARQAVESVGESIRETASIPASAFNYDQWAMTAVFGEAAGSIENWTQAVEQFGERAGRIMNESARLNFNTGGIGEAEQQIENFSGQIENMKNLFLQMFSDVKSGDLFRHLSESVGNYVKSAKTAAGIKVYTEDYRKILSDIERTEGALQKLGQKQRDMQASGTGEESKEWQKIASEITEAESRLDSYINRRNEMESSGADVEFSGGPANESILKGMGAAAGEAISSLRQKIGEIGSAVSQAVGNIPVIGRIAKESAFVGKAAFEGFKSALSGIAKAEGTAVSAVSRVASAIAKLVSGIKGAIPKFSSLAKSMIGIKGASKGMNTSFSGALRTALKYGLGIRSIYALFNKLRNAAKEAFKNLAQYSPETNASLSMLQSSLGALKNSLAAAFAPIVNVVAPYLSVFIDMVTKAFNTLGQFFTVLTGKSFVAQAKKNFSDYAAGVSKAGGAAKEAGKDAKNGAREFDELKTISMNNGEDSGGGGAEISPADMFETVPVADSVSDFAQKIKDAWANADFTEMGQTLGVKLKSALDGIPREPVQETAAKTGKSLATLMNFVDVDGLADSIGRTIGEAINIGITGINAFLDGVHWDSVGIFIGEGLNGIINTVDWEGAGHLFAAKFNAVFEVLGNAAATFDWTNFGLQLATSVNTFITDFDWAENGARLGELAKGLLDSIISFLENTDWQALGNGIADFIGNIDWGGILERIAEGIGAALGGLAALIWGLIEDAWGDVVVWWKETAFEDGKFVPEKLLEGIKEVLVNIGTWIKEHIAIPFLDGFAKAFGLDADGSELFDAGVDIVSGFLKGVLEKIKGIGTWIKEHIFQPFIEGFKKVFGIASPSKVMQEQGGFIMQGLLGGISSLVQNVIDVFDKIKEKIVGIWGAVKTKTSEVWNGIKTFVSGLWTGLKTNVSNVFGGIKTTITNIWNGIKAVTTSVWNGIKNAVKTPINGIIGFINGMTSGVSNGINGMINALNALSFDVPDWVPLIGGKTFGFSIHNISIPQIPMLANGAVLRGGKPFLAVVNDQKRGQTNVEAPLKIIQEALNEELEEFFTKAQVAIPNIRRFNFSYEPAPNPSSTGIYGNYRYDTSAYTLASNNGFDLENRKTEELLLETRRQNQLLQQQNRLLEGILKKPNIGERDIFNAAQTIYRGEAIRRYGNSEAFDPVWG